MNLFTKGLAAAVVFVLLYPADAAACSGAMGYQGHCIYEDRTYDKAPPSIPQNIKAELIESYDAGSICMSNPCLADGNLVIGIDDVRDDQSSPEEIGYEIELASGELPPNMSLPKGPISYPNKRSMFSFNYRDYSFWPDSQHFAIRIRSVDGAGNFSEWSAPVEIHYEHSLGAHLVERASLLSLLLALVLVGLVVRRRLISARSR